MNNTIDSKTIPFALDRQYMEQANNSARYIIGNKVITLRDNGDLLFYEMEDADEAAEFFFDETILDEYLTECSYLSDSERKSLTLIKSLDEKFFAVCGFNVVTATTDADAVIEDLIIVNPAWRAYFKLSIDEIDNVNDQTIFDLQQYEENKLTTPYCIKVLENGKIVKG